MYFVYFLKSESNPEQTYIGMTKCLVDRLNEHNTGQSSHTSKYMPWKIQGYIMAETHDAALAAERYFKNTSGKEKIQRYDLESNPVEAFLNETEIGKKFGRSVFEVKTKTIVIDLCEGQTRTPSRLGYNPTNQGSYIYEG